MIVKPYISVLFGVLFYFLLSGDVFAQDINDISENIVQSTRFLPALVSGLAFLSAILIGITAILKTIDHVNNPAQTPIRVPVIRFIIGGALFSLPIIIEAALLTINGGSITNFNPLGQFSALFGASNLIGFVTAYLTIGNVNSILNSIMISIGEIPAMVAAVGYLLGLVMVASAIYKTRDHVEDPDRVPLKDVVIRYLTAGMLFGLPTVFNAMYETINGGGLGFTGQIMQLMQGSRFFISSEVEGLSFVGLNLGGGACTGLEMFTGNDVGDILCTMLITSAGIPGFLAALSYIIGTVLGLWAIVKIRDHVNNPSQTPLHEGITRLIAGGAFFALPVVALAIQYSITPNVLAISVLAGTNTGFNTPTTLSCSSSSANSLDQAMACFMSDILGPSHVLLNFFTFVAGLIFIMIGISRLTRSAQEGARGPGGIGTIATFVVAGLLMSATTILRAFSGSMFGVFGAKTKTNANLLYADGMSDLEKAAAYNVVNAVLQFMIIIGMISFVRGIFIMRDVAEGQGQASTMAGMTHIIGGALAVNLGPLLNAVQATLGITAFGVTFS